MMARDGVEELGADSFVYGTSGVEGTPHDIIVRVSGRRWRSRSCSAAIQARSFAAE